MSLDEETEKKLTSNGFPRKLDGLSVWELEEYIASLRLEILRTEAEIGRQKSHKSTADALFKQS